MPMYIDQIVTGRKLKDFRIQAGLSLAQAAEKAGITAAFISMVENGKSGISFQKAHTLLAIYGKQLSDMSPDVAKDQHVVNTAQAAEVISEPGVRILGLAKSKSPYQSGGFLLYFEPGAQHAYDYHKGMDYLMVLEGSFELYLKETEDGPVEMHALHVGDTTFYPAEKWHSFRNISDKVGALFVLEIIAESAE